MHRIVKIFALAAFALLAMPAGAATWYAYGTYEPDTVEDDPAFMWTTPPGADDVRIYFNAYTTSGGLATTGANPNVGIVGTHVESFGFEQQWAILGVWTDCNGDGYVGIAESGLREYPSQLLLDTSRCPAASGVTNTCWKTASPCPNWPATGYNNARGWVTELIPIGGGETTFGDKRVIKDLAAHVWGDYGRPNDASTDTDGGTCALTPLPRGTMRSTGGLLTYADCSTGLLEAFNLLTADGYRVFGSDIPGPGDPLGLRFADDDDGTTGTLGQVPTLGSDHSDHAIVHVGDCSDPDAYGVLWPGGLPAAFYDNFGPGIRNPDPTYVNPNGNIAGTVNYTREALPLPKVQTDDETGPQSTSNCDFEDDRGSDVYLLEGDFNSVSITDKREADWNFAFQTMTRGGAPFGLVASGGTGAPNDAGVSALSGIVEGPSQWFGGSTLVGKTPQAVVVRGTLGEGDLNPEIDNAYWLTFYAVVGGTTTGTGAALPGNTPGKYGAAQCGENDQGVHNGWNCAAALWNLDGEGAPLPDPYNAFARPGKLYNLLDVDCFDGELRGTGVGVLPAFYGPGPCR